MVMPETFTRVKHIPHIPETVVVSSVWVVGLADTVVVELDRDWYVKEEELSLLMLAMDEVVGIRVPCEPSPLPPSPSKMQKCLMYIINMVVNISLPAF